MQITWHTLLGIYLIPDIASSIFCVGFADVPCRAYRHEGRLLYVARGFGRGLRYVGVPFSSVNLGKAVPSHLSRAKRDEILSETLELEVSLSWSTRPVTCRARQQ